MWQNIWKMEHFEHSFAFYWSAAITVSPSLQTPDATTKRQNFSQTSQFCHRTLIIGQVIQHLLCIHVSNVARCITTLHTVPIYLMVAHLDRFSKQKVLFSRKSLFRVVVYNMVKHCLHVCLLCTTGGSAAPEDGMYKAMDNYARNRRPLMHMTGSLFNSFIIWKIVKKPFVELASIVIEE